jgi:hypothetical protein
VFSRVRGRDDQVEKLDCLGVFAKPKLGEHVEIDGDYIRG